MTDTINLSGLKMKHLTILDAELYCKIFNINPDNIISLNLCNNYLTDISGISIFKNSKQLELSDNQITDISSLKNLIKLEFLNISYNHITDISYIKNLKNLKNLDITALNLSSSQIKYINSIKNLKNLDCYYGFEDIDDLFKLNKTITYIDPFDKNDPEDGYYNDTDWREKGSISGWSGY